MGNPPPAVRSLAEAMGAADLAATAGARDGDWQCPGCGNLNYAKRDICNTRKCQHPRPVNYAPPMISYPSSWSYSGGTSGKGSHKTMPRSLGFSAASASTGDWE